MLCCLQNITETQGSGGGDFLSAYDDNDDTVCTHECSASACCCCGCYQKEDVDWTWLYEERGGGGGGGGGGVEGDQLRFTVQLSETNPPNFSENCNKVNSDFFIWWDKKNVNKINNSSF